MTTAVKRENGFIAKPLKAPSAVKTRITTDLATHARIKERESVIIRNAEYHATATMMCGSCDRPAALHPIKGASENGYFTLACNREPDSFPYVPTELTERSDYLLWPTGDITIPDKHYFDQSEDKFIDPDDYVSADIELDALERYYDKAPQEVTLTLEEHQALYGASNYVPTVMRSYFDPEQRNAYVDATDGFTISKFLDDLLTRKYQNHLINAFVDKRTGKPRVGSVELTITPGSSLDAHCVSCNKAFTVDINNSDRDTQERTAWAIISHGNNHAAKFIREKTAPVNRVVTSERTKFEYAYEMVQTPDGPEWIVTGVSVTKQVDISTDGDNDKIAVFYNLPGTLSDKHSITVPEELNSAEAIEFLFDHQRYCKVSTCTCSEWLAYLTPALAV